jgi:hypothetical protein
MATMAAAIPSTAPSGSKETLATQAANMCPVGRTLGLSADFRTNDNVRPAASCHDDLSELAIPNIYPD